MLCPCGCREQLTGSLGVAVRYMEAHEAAERLDAAIAAGGRRAAEAARLLEPWVEVRDASHAAATGDASKRPAAAAWHRSWIGRVDDLLDRGIGSSGRKI